MSFEDADQRPFREVIVRVVGIEGNTVTLEAELPFDFDSGETDVFQIDLLEGIVLEDFTVTSGIEGDPNANDFVNTHPGFENTSDVVPSSDGW